MPVNTSKKPIGKVRIIAGRWRGLMLTVPEAKSLRPTGDRIRETLFNWLQPYLPGSRCLDLFAGSGVLGFEAVSRGAAKAVLVDNNQLLIQKLTQDKERLKAIEVELVCRDALGYLGEASREMDIVFLDPPFDTYLMEGAIAMLEQRGWLARQALIYLETPADVERCPFPESWSILKEKKSGNVVYCLAQRSL